MSILCLDNISLAEKLRNEDAEQFYTLVRMHLSFVLDLNADDCESNSEKKFRTPKWNLGLLQFSKKPKLPVKAPGDGWGLTADTVLQMQQLITFLCEEENICQEGIFRRSGKLTRQQALKALISQGAVVDLGNSEYSVHDCASVLKSILAELPESILTEAHYPAYCQIAEMFDMRSDNYEDRLLRSLQLLILLLPMENRNLLKDLIALLHLAASHQDRNRMSSDNLATLFTPHLLCPRKLSPEALHTNSQVMSKVVAFMIDQGPSLFEVPPTLATDVKAYWNNKEKKKRSPLKQMNESVCDGAAASTVFSFVDRERTAQENVANPTETALAQLYAYIQSLPESSKKRKLIKQFNKENGQGTPLRVSTGQKKRTRSRSLGDSIKKRLPVFNKGGKQRAGGHDSRSPMAITQLASPPILHELSAKKSGPGPSLKPCLVEDKPITFHRSRKVNNEEALSSLRMSIKNKSKSCELLEEAAKEEYQVVRRSQRRPAEEGVVKAPSSKSPRYSSEAKTDWPVSMQQHDLASMHHATNTNSKEEDKLSAMLYNYPKTPVNSHPMFSYRNRINIDSLCSTPRALIMTSTPAPRPGAARLVTPVVDNNNSMSPITKSTQRMPKAMQETMMTPRSRKPVISLSGTDLCNLASMDSWKAPIEEDVFEPEHKEYNLHSDASTSRESLSSTFRDYLFSRSVLTASPVDLSFSSRTDDFLSLSERNSSLVTDEFKSILNDGGLSESLLYCLDGNEPQSNDNSAVEREPEPAKDHVYETAL